MNSIMFERSRTHDWPVILISRRKYNLSISPSPQMMLTSVPPQQFAPFSWQQQQPQTLQTLPLQPLQQQQQRHRQQQPQFNVRHALSSEDVRHLGGAFSDGEATERSAAARRGYGSMQHHHRHRGRRPSAGAALEWRAVAARQQQQPHYVTMTRWAGLCYLCTLELNSTGLLG